eukprot:PhF_6_TR10353/c1_g2_i8/m.16020
MHCSMFTIRFVLHTCCYWVLTISVAPQNFSNASNARELQSQLSSSVFLPNDDVIINVTGPIDLQEVGDVPITIDRDDVRSITIVCAKGSESWLCVSGGACIVILKSRNVTVSGCSMLGGGISTTTTSANESSIVGMLTVLDGLIDGMKRQRALSLRNVVNVTIRGMTIQNGRSPLGMEGGCIFMVNVQSLTLTNTTVRMCVSSNNGGCMFLSGYLTASCDTNLPSYSDLRSTAILSNSTFQTCNISGFGEGGALNIGCVKDVWITDVAIANAASQYGGGCIRVQNVRSLTINRTQFQKCVIRGMENRGGCLSLTADRIELNHSLVSDCNGAEEGGCARIQNSSQ